MQIRKLLTIISRDTASFVQECQVLQKHQMSWEQFAIKSNTQNIIRFLTDLPTGNYGNRKRCLFLWFLFILPTDPQSSESTEHGLGLYDSVFAKRVLTCWETWEKWGKYWLQLDECLPSTHWKLYISLSNIISFAILTMMTFVWL